jgi:hypothetical protein
MAKTNVKRVQKVDVASPTTSSAKPTRRGAARKAGPVAPSPITTSPTVKLTKRDQLAGLLVREEGATLDHMIAATGWLPHTTRAALTGLRKAGYAIDSDKVDGVRTYRAVAPK